MNLLANCGRKKLFRQFQQPEIEKSKKKKIKNLDTDTTYVCMCALNLRKYMKILNYKKLNNLFERRTTLKMK